VGAGAIPAAAQSTTRGEPRPIAELFQDNVRQDAASASPDAIVARMMSFDRNHDGLVSRDELPERMQPLLTRIEVFTTSDALDETEIRRLAENPIAKPQVFVLQAGRYGFGEDSGFDTRLHIESAIEDLRLAGDTREKAIDIGHRFADTMSAQEKADVIAALTPLLSEDQIGRVSTLLNRELDVHLQVPDVDPARLRAAAALAIEMLKRRELASLIASFQLGVEQAKKVNDVVAQFQTNDRLTDASRSALLKQMDGLLSEQEQGDLRAALERRPVVKQGVGSVFSRQ
jgi:hypothetical protein